MTFTSPRAWAFTLLGIHEYLARASSEQAAAMALRELLTEKAGDTLESLRHGGLALV